MIKQIWINLPVNNVKASQKFYSQIGFQQNTSQPANKVSASFFVGSQKVILMLFEKTIFEKFTQNKSTDTMQSNEVLFSIDAESTEEVDSFSTGIESAGGKIFSPPGLSQGWMYGFGFSDPDGHRWNMLYMDMAKLPK